MTDPLEEEQTTWNASLSTMWAMGNFPVLQDFIHIYQRLGFASLELNHQVDSAMLARIDLSKVQVTSVHEPCPADISAETLKNRDWLMSATDEESRNKGVGSIKRTIDLACSLGARAVVIHAGNVQPDCPLEKELYSLYRSGQAHSPEYQEVKNRLVEIRASLAGPRLESVMKSLVELLEYARHTGVRLGLENRYHYMDIPALDEMDVLLQLAGPEQLGFWYDVGHAQALDRLGFYAHDEWLERYAERMVGVHLHDVVGISDHRAPGTGEVDFAKLAAYLPANVIHTCEIRESTTPEQVKAGLQYLAKKGCVRCQ